MDMSFYTCSVGAHQQQRRLDIHANNIANVNNYGFKARRPSFSVLMTGSLRGINEELARGAGSRLESAEMDQGSEEFWGTERGLDYAIEGNGFFALLDPTTGEYRYTREGSFTLSNVEEEIIPEDDIVPQRIYRWYLSDGEGRYVLGTDGQPIVVEDPMEAHLVGKPLPIGIFDFINYNGMLNQYNGMVPVAKNGQVALGNSGKLVQGYLELSNVDYAYEITKVVETQRSFQYMLRMVQTSDEITTTVNGLR